MKILVKKHDGLILPKKANNSDAAYDVFAATDPTIVGDEVKNGIYRSIKYIEYGTGLYVSPQDSYEMFSGPFAKKLDTYWIQGLPRSSISKYNLVVANSCPTIDNGYRGEIKIRFKYIIQPEDIILDRKYFDGEAEWNIIGARVNTDKIYKKGDAIIQVRPVKDEDIDWRVVDELDSSDRNSDGFGSSGNNSAK
jgi:dUTPase